MPSVHARSPSRQTNTQNQQPQAAGEAGEPYLIISTPIASSEVHAALSYLQYQASNDHSDPPGGYSHKEGRSLNLRCSAPRVFVPQGRARGGGSA